ETYSKFVNARDRSARAIFGDGAAATLVGQEGTGFAAIGPFVFGTDGSGAENLIVPTGGLRRRATPNPIERQDEDGNWRSDQNLSSNGREVFSFTPRAVPAAVRRLLRDADLGIGDVDYFVFHQANQFMLERLRDKLEIPADRFALDVSKTGNTVS